MQTIIKTAWVVCAVFLAVLTSGGCSTTQINTELPLNHPANPAAEASGFVPPPNPFATDVSLAEPSRPRSDAGKSEKQQEGAMHHHEMQTMQPKNDTPDGSQKEKTEHQH